MWVPETPNEAVENLVPILLPGGAEGKERIDGLVETNRYNSAVVAGSAEGQSVVGSFASMPKASCPFGADAA